MEGEVTPYGEAVLLDLLEQEREALRRADVGAVLAIARRKLKALYTVAPAHAPRLHELAAQNHDLIAHLAASMRSVLLAAVSPDGTLYGPCGGAPPMPEPMRRRHG